ncbi:MAG: MarR family transcriptional regulator [Lachnospiraceae bacterium]|nr:MarR family transcriptional regulator [Lachnospiraceae bacterium]MDY5497098.1 MarR family transcriptional regulator [Anaerobutyricum sp.]
MKKEEMIGFVIRALDNLMMRNAMEDEPMRKEGMMPILQGWILDYLYENKEKEVFQRDIEAEFFVARSTVTCAVKQMEKKGLIERTAVDRDSRLKKLSILPEGEMIREHFLQNIEIAERKMRQNIDKEELQIFFDVAAKIRKNLERRECKDFCHQM